jgi:hypothetical protein
MLGTRLTATRWVVSLFDDALSEIDYSLLVAYSTSRNLDYLGDLSKLEHKPVMFEVAPITTRTERFMDDDHMTFAYCVRDMKHAPPEWNSEWKETAGLRYMEDAAREKIPLNVIQEIAQVAREMANGDSAPFSPPDGWAGFRARATLVASAKSVLIVPASDTENGS